MKFVFRNKKSVHLQICYSGRKVIHRKNNCSRLNYDLNFYIWKHLILNEKVFFMFSFKIISIFRKKKTELG